ncbi:MAG: hypothetical protein UT84_C0001G0021 [Candidatus Curtissbacteria bacterium GW2011_GWA1_40_16]|uniref:Phage holin family protein n=1 Tax=Candidatus Curtissbacteria bacterium GW2011_GWA1_40_16 TaxID=1618405 RepID=A0A0G0RN63_9BACT|nr:MAG: hypothetical protein UT84_C0001G0021 [Candidatus Curtissbacteria bacterium GW2011_GWA1_40_16]
MDQMRLIKFLSTWVINSVLLVVISQIFAGSVVLGNAVLSKGIAAVFSGFLLTTVFFLVPVAVEKSEAKIKDFRFWLILDFLALVIGVWAVKRLSVLTGLGIANILLVLVVAVLVALFDFATDKYSDTLLKKNK